MSLDSRRLQPLLQRADRREQEAMRRLAERQSQLASQEQRLAELRRYLHDYSERAPLNAGVAMLRNRQAFLARLREAEDCQRAAVERARGACDDELAQWRLQRRDLGVLEQLSEACRRREDHQQERRAQRVLDELAVRRVIAASRPA